MLVLKFRRCFTFSRTVCSVPPSGVKFWCLRCLLLLEVQKRRLLNRKQIYLIKLLYRCFQGWPVQWCNNGQLEQVYYCCTLSNFFFSLDNPPSPFLFSFFSFFLSFITAFVFLYKHHLANYQFTERDRFRRHRSTLQRLLYAPFHSKCSGSLSLSPKFGLRQRQANAMSFFSFCLSQSLRQKLTTKRFAETKLRTERSLNPKLINSPVDFACTRYVG